MGKVALWGNLLSMEIAFWGSYVFEEAPFWDRLRFGKVAFWGEVTYGGKLRFCINFVMMEVKCGKSRLSCN